MPFDAPILRRRFFWRTCDIRVTLCASDYAAHTSEDLHQGAIAHQSHGRVLRTTLPLDFSSPFEALLTRAFSIQAFIFSSGALANAPEMPLLRQG